MPNFNILYITDFEMLQEALSLDVFSGRGNEVFKSAFMVGIRGGGTGFHGLSGSEGQLWKEQRRFALKHLRDFGFGRSSMEEIIRVEFDDLAEKFRLSKGKEDINVHMLFNVSVINVLWSIISGSRFDMNNPEAVKRMEDMDSLFKAFEPTNPILIMQSMLPEWLALPFAKGVIQK